MTISRRRMIIEKTQGRETHAYEEIIEDTPYSLSYKSRNLLNSIIKVLGTLFLIYLAFVMVKIIITILIILKIIF